MQGTQKSDDAQVCAFLVEKYGPPSFRALRHGFKVDEQALGKRYTRECVSCFELRGYPGRLTHDIIQDFLRNSERLKSAREWYARRWNAWDPMFALQESQT